MDIPARNISPLTRTTQPRQSAKKSQVVSDKTVLFLVINMYKNKNRYFHISKQLNMLQQRYNFKYIRVEGVDGFKLEEDPWVKTMLRPRTHLLGNTLTCLESNDSWVYDGTIATSFPGLHYHGHWGSKGLTMSNLKCYTTIQEKYPDYNWYCILEDDSEITEEIYTKINQLVKSNPQTDIILLDARFDGRGGTAGMIYNDRIIDHMLQHLHPLSEFSIVNESRWDERANNVWDWKLWHYIDTFNIKNISCPIIHSGKFISMISHD